MGGTRVVCSARCAHVCAELQEETAMFKSLGAQRLLALFLVGCGLLNFPLLALWSADVTVWGIALFPLALYVIWALLIAALAWMMERALPEQEDEA
jgi:hypothetical protein